MIKRYKRFVERVDDDAWEGTDQDWNDDWSGGNRKKTPLPSRFDMSGEIADDDFYDNEYYGGVNHNFNDYDNRDLDRDPDLSDDDIEDDIEHLKYLIKGMFKNKGFNDIFISNNKLDLMIRCNLSHKEKLSDVVSLFDLVSKLKTDILPQYDSEYDTWESQKGQVMEFGFYYSDILNDNDDYLEDDE